MESCKKIGIDAQTLYFIEFKEFKNKNPEIRPLSKDVQILRYNHYNKMREQTIQTLQEVNK